MFDGFEALSDSGSAWITGYADKIVQPSLTIYSSSAFTAPCSTQFVEKLTNEHEELAFDEFSHVDFYYKPEAVKASTDAVANFFNK